MESGYTAKEMAPILGISVRAVQLRAKKEGWLYDKESCRGGKILRYRVSSMSKQARDAIVSHALDVALSKPDQPLNGNGLHVDHNGAPVNGNGASVNPPGNVMALVPTSSRGSATPSALIVRSQAIPDRAYLDGQMKARLVMEWRDLVKKSPWGKKDEATKAFLVAYNTGKLLPSVFAVVGRVSDKTLYRLDKKLRESNDDCHALADGRGGWRIHGSNNWRERDLSQEAQEAFLRCYLDSKVTVASAIRAAKLLLDQAGIAEEASDATYRRWLHGYERLHMDVIVCARDGEKAYKDLVGPYITRDDTVLRVGQCLVADGHDLNFQILHPSTGKPCRMKLITFFDWASRVPVGWQIMPTENTIAIQAALRMAILTLGRIPEAAYLDNGKAFKSRVFTATNPDLKGLMGIYARLGIATVFAQPYNARAKLLERWHLTLNEQCERIIPTYCGSSIADKPPWMQRNEKLHRAWHEAKTGGWVPNVREAAYLIWRYCQWYAEQPHEGLGGRRPIDVLEAGMGPGVDVESLNRHFLWRETVHPKRCRVRLYNIDYESDCLHGYSGDAIAMYDTADLSRIWIYTPEGGYVGEAVPVQALHPLARLFGDEVSVDQVKAEIARQRRLAKQTKDNLEALGASAGMVAGLKALPWNQMAAVLPGGKSDCGQGSESNDAGGDAGQLEEKESAERERLQLVINRAVEADEEAARAEAERPKIERPEYFRSEAARYEWCFRTKHQHGQALTADDEKFCRYWEETSEYQVSPVT